jgi:aspartate/methionine/tyrosine aminotransferase
VQEIMVTNGANQAFGHIAFTLIDDNDTALIFAPYYFSHKVALQIAGAITFHTSRFIPFVMHRLSRSACSYS